jgi:hypothetical protein
MKFVKIAVFAAALLVPALAEAVQATITIPTQAVDANRTGIRVERQDGGTGAFAAQTTLPANGTSYNQTGLTVGVTYCYRVIPTGPFGDGPVLGPACGTSGLPGALNGPITIIIAP